ncbi:TetR/AcrR family transcriptional regulator [Janibacter sp. YIM B02568]|uniref:TetR/AcrR family transcriptional regulator n=1 Tax=Janibacter endophyticus TaxID=2806261 RepID=UPI00194DE1B7|nr:TetR/AcrR family transcriptional regulator [Janibacter endophyticus]MBM6545707.1 TetR/AcrR family transcriptional regulator [Janibacter endophyticus]
MTGSPQGVQRLPRAQRRAQLLEAAQTVFVRKGYHSAAMEDIAEEAGVSKPVLYQHFPGKLELYLALLESQCDRLETLVLDALENSSDHKDRVYRTIAAFFEFVGGEGEAFRLVFESDLTSDPQVRHRLDGLEAQVGDAISQRVAEDTGLPKEFADLLGITLVGMSQISARAWLARGSQIPREDAARAAGHLAWRGIGSFPTVATKRAVGEGQAETDAGA